VFLPQHIVRTLFYPVACITILSASIAIARAENTPTRKSEPAGHNQQLLCNVAGLQLGEVVVGRATGKLVTITNQGKASLSVLSAASTGVEFGLNGLDLPLTLAAGESFTFSVTFAPQRSGRADGSISIVSQAPIQTLTIPLAGTGTATGQLRIAPGVIDFGVVQVGARRTQIGQLTAGAASVTVSSARISSESFQLSGLSLPVTIPANRSVPFRLTFASQGSGSASAILSFASNAENSPTEQVVTVRTFGPGPHKVHLLWKASKSKHVAGYNVYRGSRLGGPYKKINHSLDPATNYTDRHVVAGCKYYYVARAVNMRGPESNNSKHVQAVIPCGPVITDTDWHSETNLFPKCGFCGQ
jgi:hypothetical protein